MTHVVVKNGQIDDALKKFNRKLSRNGVPSEVKKRQEGYKKPGVERREARVAARKNANKRARRDRAA
ncbi:MAG: 30S ribosomal protein S21 [Bacilli bacterium]|nr:30S ribosomal protein S21 [Bacilli bacterium]